MGPLDCIRVAPFVLMRESDALRGDEQARRVLAALGALGDFLGKDTLRVFVHNDGVDLTQWGKEHKAAGIDFC